MMTVEVEIPKNMENLFADSKKMTFFSFIQTVDTLNEQKWVDTKLDSPIEMSDFYNLLKKEL